jgi:hypothetical protein
MSRRTLALMLAATALGLSALVIADTPPGLTKPQYMPAYYDDELFLINFQELPDGGEDAIHAHNPSFNTIYQSDQAVAAGFNFVSVLDAIQGDGFNPLWEEVQIVFPDNKFKQFTSDNEVNAAFMAGQIVLRDTDEIYRCAVVGPK